MTLKHMKIFVEVCETGSVTKAAEKLFITQPAASAAITELENYYGVKLFDRISRRLYINDMGRQFLQYALHIVSLFDELDKSVKNWDSLGIIRIGASITIGNYLLPEYIKDFKGKFRDIRTKVIIDNTEKIEEYILNNELDIGFIENTPQSPYIIKKHFKNDPLIIICPNEHIMAEKDDVSIYDISKEEFILREKGSAGRDIFDKIMEINGMNIEPVWQSVSTQAIVKAVSKGLGISVLPYLLVKESLEAGIISRIKLCNNEINSELVRKFYVIYHKNKYMTKSASNFIENIL